MSIETENKETVPQQNPAQPAHKMTRKEKKEAKKNEPKSLKKEIMSWVWTILAAVIIATLIRSFLFEPIRVDGESMLETLQNGEIVLVTKTEYLTGDPQRGDVVICHYPNSEYKDYNWTTKWQVGASFDITFSSHTLLVKRLIGLPGDTVEIKNRQLYINGELYPESYITYSPRTDYAARTLGENEYLVMGDNRANSHDGRSADVGPITRDMIVGHVRSVIWPLNKIRGIE